MTHEELPQVFFCCITICTEIQEKVTGGSSVTHNYNELHRPKQKATKSTHVQVPDADLPIEAPRSHQTQDGGVKCHTPRGAPMAHQRVNALSRLHLRDVDVMVDMSRCH